MSDEDIEITERVVGEPPTPEQPEQKLEALDPYEGEELQEVAQGAENLEKPVEEAPSEIAETKESEAIEEGEEEELPRSVQKRLAKATREKHEALERAIRAEVVAQQYVAQQPQSQQVQRDPYAPVEPLENDPRYQGNDKAYFKDYIQYQKNLIQYEAQKHTAQRYQTEVEQKYIQQFAEAQEKYDDFDEVFAGLSRYPVINQHPNLVNATAAIKELNNSGDVVYHLAKNPNDFIALLNKNPMTMVMELGRISGRVEAAPTKAIIPRAPAPPKKLNGSASPPQPKRHFADLSLDEMEAKFRSLS